MSARAYGVVLPAHDAACTIGQALESLLAQDPAPEQIVVVDDGSRDQTAEVASTYGPAVRVVSQDNAGPAAATDRGLAELATPLFACLDADDVWFAGKAALQLQALAADPDALVFCRMRVFSDGSDPAASEVVQDGWGRSTVFAHRATFESVGPMHQRAGDRAVGEFLNWLDRARLLGLRTTMLPEVLAGRRRIAGSRSDATVAGSYLPLVRAALERRRRRP